jgi:Restriction endonuclease
MPEELAIAVIVLVVAGWLIIKLFQAIATGLSDAHRELSKTIAKRAEQTISKKKSRLAQHVRVHLPNELEQTQEALNTLDAEFKQFQATTVWNPQRPLWVKEHFAPYFLPDKSLAWDEMDVQEIASILQPNAITRLQQESAIVMHNCDYPFEPPKSTCSEFKEFPAIDVRLEVAAFDVDLSVVNAKQLSRFFHREQDTVLEYNKRRSEIVARCDDLKSRIQTWNVDNRKRWNRYVEESKLLEGQERSKFTLHRDQYVRDCVQQKERTKTMVDGFAAGLRPHVIARVEHILGSLRLPSSVPRSWEVDFDEDQRILIVDLALPDVVHRPPFKTVVLKNGPVKKPLSQTERKEAIPRIHPAIILRVAYELFRNDDAGIIGLMALNGWVSFDDPNTGINTKAYTASLMLERSQMVSLNLEKLDPLPAFQSLNGKSAGKLIEIIPIEPSLCLNKKDARFVDAKAVLNMLGNATNLAAMDWQDFEHLIRELFEREFAGRGAEVKITQASRDRGVDAIAFDPDPIRGGKYVIQAKRYTNTVDVSAVRDLCAVVRKEGASRGILVTTSTYGADAYAFANNEPVTLLNGAELLGLLKKHGYTFRINLQQARQLSAR